MKTFGQIVMQISYFLGLLALILGVLMRFVPPLAERIAHKPGGVLSFALVLFLCALASYAVSRTKAS
jgi:hypothetical protein